MEEEFRDRVALTTAEYGEQVDTTFRVSVQGMFFLIEDNPGPLLPQPPAEQC
jgi:hypothetical protein